MKVSGVWEILTRFKDSCRRRGWRTSETEDWVEVKNGYHNFVWVKDINLSSFKKISTSNKCIIHEGFTYRVVPSSYTAWLFSQTPSESLTRTVLNNPTLSCRTALYDLSSLQDGESVCSRLNSTDSSVFKEFEGFLKNQLKVNFQPLPYDPDSERSRNECTAPDLA